jgi:sugar lactone lactonase YvrE
MHISRIGLALVGLRSGLLRSLDVDLTGVAGEGSLVWSPDGRWVFCVDTTNRLVAVDVSSGAVSLLDPRLPSVSQLAIRMGS